MHATLGNEFNGRDTMPVKRYLFKEYDAWFLDQESALGERFERRRTQKRRSRFLREVEASSSPFLKSKKKDDDDSDKTALAGNSRQLVWVNGALLYPNMFPLGYERVDLAAGIGMAIALNRTLVRGKKERKKEGTKKESHRATLHCIFRFSGLALYAVCSVFWQLSHGCCQGPLLPAGPFS